MEAHEKQLYDKLKALFLNGYREADIQLLHLALDYGVNYRDAEDILIEAVTDAASETFQEWQQARTVFCAYLGVDIAKITPPWDSMEKLWELRNEIGVFAGILMRMSPRLPIDDDALASELDFSDDPLDREGEAIADEIDKVEL